MLGRWSALLTRTPVLLIWGSAVQAADLAKVEHWGQSCKTATILTAGLSDYPQFFFDDKMIDFVTGPGISLVTIDPDSQEVLSANLYRTHDVPEIPDQMKFLREDIQNLPVSTIVLVAFSQVEPSMIDANVRAAMKEIGVEALGEVGGGYAVISNRAGRIGAVTRGHNEKAEATIDCEACPLAEVQSRGVGHARFFLGGKELSLDPSMQHATGLVVVTIDPVTGAVFSPAIYEIGSSGTQALVRDLEELPEGWIVMVASQGLKLNHLTDAERLALASVGAFNLGGGHSEAYALLGSKSGTDTSAWAVDESQGHAATAQGRVPCQAYGSSIPSEEVVGTFPGKTEAQSNAAWASGKQPASLSLWPRDGSELKPCWKSTVLDDTANGWPGTCRGLAFDKGVDSPEGCQKRCTEEVYCSVWQFTGGECWRGTAIHCDWGTGEEPAPGVSAQRMQMGDVRVLQQLSSVQVLNLYEIKHGKMPVEDAVRQCQLWCYSEVLCQYWQYVEDSCFVEAPRLSGWPVEYPLTAKGISSTSWVATHLIAGEYIQHFCPPEPLCFNGSKVFDATERVNGDIINGRPRRGAGWPSIPAFQQGSLRGSQDKAEDAGPAGVDQDSQQIAETVAKAVGAELAKLRAEKEKADEEEKQAAEAVKKQQDSEIEKLKQQISDLQKLKGEQDKAAEKEEEEKQQQIREAEKKAAAEEEAKKAAEIQKLRDEVSNLHGALSDNADDKDEGKDAAVHGEVIVPPSTKSPRSRAGSSHEASEKGPGWEPSLKDSSFPWWYAPLLLTVLACMAMGCLMALRARLYRKRKPPVSMSMPAPKPKPADVFRLNATKDRYDYYEVQEYTDELMALLPFDKQDRFSGRKVVVVLERAALELYKALEDRSSPLHSTENELLIVHECLMALLDSPLNKSGHLLIYISTGYDVVVEVHPSMRVPRLFSKFTSMVEELMRMGNIVGPGDVSLMRVLRTSIDKVLPESARRYALTVQGRSRTLRNIAEDPRTSSTSSTMPAPEGSDLVVFAVGASDGDAIAETNCASGYTQEKVSVCPWGLRSQCVCQMVCHEFENAWGVYSSAGKLVEEFEWKQQ